MIAFRKLDLYMNLVQAAVRVSGVHSHLQFLDKTKLDGMGYLSDDSSLCSYCNEPLIDKQMLHRFQTSTEQAKDKENTWRSILDSSIFTFNLSGRNDVSLEVGIMESEDWKQAPTLKSFVMYRCRHKFHTTCVLKKLREDNPDLVEREMIEAAEQPEEQRFIVNSQYKGLAEYKKDRRKRLVVLRDKIENNIL